jgi:hypothetical protein
MVRRLQPEELQLCVPGGKAFFDEAGLPGAFDEEYFTRRLSAMASSGAVVVMGSFGPDGIRGAIAFTRYTDPFTGDIVASELWWFVLPEHRKTPSVAVGLLKAYETWARENCCKRISMVHLHALQADRIGRLYERVGYKLMESAYVKILNC